MGSLGRRIGLVARTIGQDSHTDRAPKTIVANWKAASRGHQQNDDPPTWQCKRIHSKDTLVQDPGTWRCIHSSLIGYNGDTRGKLMCTLDDASERRTKDVRENAGAVPTRGSRDKGCWWECERRRRSGSQMMSRRVDKSGHSVFYEFTACTCPLKSIVRPNG